MVWSKAVSVLKRVLGLSPGIAPRLPRVTVAALPSAPDAPLDSGEVLVCVSRHGLQQGGVRCPICSEIVAQPGDWTKVLGTNWGEAIMCSPCKKVLLASPDTDVDPIKPGEPYDEKIYHTFARPEGWQPPRQRVIARPPVKDDWVAVQEKCLVEINGVLQDLNGAEGRVVSVDGDTLVMALSGNSGMAGSEMGAQMVTLPLTIAKVMPFQSLAVGNRVRVLRGEHRDQIGVIQSFKQGDCVVFFSGAHGTGTTHTLPVERLERIFDA